MYNKNVSTMMVKTFMCDVKFLATHMMSERLCITRNVSLNTMNKLTLRSDLKEASLSLTVLARLTGWRAQAVATTRGTVHRP